MNSEEEEQQREEEEENGGGMKTESRHKDKITKKDRRKDV